MARLIGLLFGLTVAGLSAWVSWEWSQLYVDYVGGPENYRPAFFLGPVTSKCVLAGLGTFLGFTIAGVIYRQALDLLRAFVADLSRIPARDKVAVVLGLFIGLGLTALLATLPWRSEEWGPPLVALLGIASVYLGVLIMLSMKEEISWLFRERGLEAAQESAPAPQPKLLDTNVIIDGRISDIARAGFIEGALYIPDFVLEELHLIADSSDDLKRNRGRRGLDILNQMQQQLGGAGAPTSGAGGRPPYVQVRVYDQHTWAALSASKGRPGARLSGVEAPQFKRGDPVDVKLVQLAKDLDGAIVTNDFNLNKVAQLQGVRVLNVNELANAMKPVVLPGEEMTVTVVREGKEPDQGVAYLDDGTMVVVEHGKDRIGTTISIIVTSVLQTVAGKMIFGYPQGDSRSPQERYDGRKRPFRGVADAAGRPFDTLRASPASGGQAPSEAEGRRPEKGERREEKGGS